MLSFGGLFNVFAEDDKEDVVVTVVWAEVIGKGTSSGGFKGFE